MNDLPLVTIAIPTYNRVEYLKQALASAQAQTYPNLEIIVSDNASSDGTQAFMERVTDKRVRYTRQLDNLGMIANWNDCLNQASGKYFLLLSDDDLLEREAILYLTQHLEIDENLVFSYSCTKFINSRGNLIKKSKNGLEIEQTSNLIKAYMMSKRELPLCGILFRKSELFFDNEYSFAADTKAWLDICFSNPKAFVKWIKLPQVSYRVHQENATATSNFSYWVSNLLGVGLYYKSRSLDKNKNAIFNYYFFRNTFYLLVKDRKKTIFIDKSVEIEMRKNISKPLFLLIKFSVKIKCAIFGNGNLQG